MAAAVLGGTVGAPVAAGCLLLELTGDGEVLLPTVAAAVVAVKVKQALEKRWRGEGEEEKEEKEQEEKEE